MTFNLPLPNTTLIALAGGLGAAVVVAYILKMRRRRHEVPFSKLWQRVLREKEASAWWRRLKRLISLVIQLAVLALIIGAALDPRTGNAQTSGKHVVVILDASASMRTLEDGKPRLELAKEEARQILAGLGGADAAMFIRMDGQPSALSRFESDTAPLVRLVDKQLPSDTPADLLRALGAASDALRGRKDPMIIVIGDGAYPAAVREQIVWAPGTAKLGQVDLTGVDVRFVPVGARQPNVGIVAFNVRRYISNKLSYEVLIEVQNFSDVEVTRGLTLFAGDEAIDVKTLTLAPGERQRQIYPDLGGGDDRVLRAQLAGADNFPLDDTAHALLPERKKQRVLLVTADNLYIEAALLLDPNITVDKVRPAEYAATDLKPYQVVVFDSHTPDKLPPLPAIYFKPTGASAPFAARGEVTRPFITEVNPDHPITRWVTLTDVNITRSSVFTVGEGDVVVARSIRDPIIVAGKREGKKLVAFGFGLDGTDLTLRVAFPVLLVNTLDWFAGDDAGLTTYRTGRVWSIPVDPEEKLREITVRGPDGVKKAPVQNGRARFFGQLTGIYTLSAPDGDLAVAANLSDPVESDVTPAATLNLGGKDLTPPPKFTPTLTRSLWVYLVLGALLILGIEWATYQRRVTV